MSNATLLKEFLSFLTESPTPYHATANLVTLLKATKFELISESCPDWSSQITEKGRYVVTRNGSSLIAFVMPSVPIKSGTKKNSRCLIVGAHSDSPCLKLKVNQSKVTNKDGFLMLPVETYGGGIWHTWFDRDLSLAGRIQYSSTSNGDEKCVISESLINITKPVARIPNLAIHLDRSVNTDGFKFNSELQLQAIYGLSSKSTTENNGTENKDLLNEILKSALFDGRNATILGHDLSLYDCTPASISGFHQEFVVSGRLDNLFMSYCTIRGLLDSLNLSESSSNKNDTDVIRMIAIFDHEEVGSEMFCGADGNFIPSVLDKLSDLNGLNLASSLLISADMAHSVHPNYGDKYDQNHRPHINEGIVIKHHSGARYATQSRTSAAIRQFCSLHDIKVQDFMVCNDSPCGSTIGPMLAAKLGIPTVDLGMAQLAMHSCREIAGTKDVQTACSFFQKAFQNPSSLLDSLITD